jgi:hypothetical protein
MASGQVNRAEQAEHVAAPTNAANVKKVLANLEPSTHGPTGNVCADTITVRLSQEQRIICPRCEHLGP